MVRLAAHKQGRKEGRKENPTKGRPRALLWFVFMDALKLNMFLVTPASKSSLSGHIPTIQNVAN